MSAVTLLNKNIHKTYEWLKDIEETAGWEYEDREQALCLLRAVLHELRDNLLINDLAHFSAQLPTVIRGLLFENWHPVDAPLKERKSEDFIRSILNHLPDIYKDIDVDTAISAVFQVIARKIDPNEFAKLQKIVPQGIRKLMVEFAF